MGHDHRIVPAELDRTRLDDAVRELTTDGVDALGAVCDITDMSLAASTPAPRPANLIVRGTRHLTVAR